QPYISIYHNGVDPNLNLLENVENGRQLAQIEFTGAIGRRSSAGHQHFFGRTIVGPGRKKCAAANRGIFSVRYIHTGNHVELWWGCLAQLLQIRPEVTRKTVNRSSPSRRAPRPTRKTVQRWIR